MTRTDTTMKSLRTRLAAALFAAIAATPIGAQTPTPLNLATDPLLGTRDMHPNVALAVSVEFPTIGAAFNRVAYTAGVEAVGYFNSDKCYDYDSANQWFYATGNAASDYSCSGKFSGNFLNWATMSSIDIFRFALVGGQRYVDTTSNTVLARAWLPNGDTVGGMSQPSNFYANSTYFPRRWVSSSENPTGTNFSVPANNNVAIVAPNTVTPWAQTRISVVNCRDEVLFGLWDGSGSPSCDAPLRDARFSTDSPGPMPPATVRRYKVRVKVCDATEGPTRGDLCMSYPNGGSPIYKPVGQMQKNADNMRFSVFGYLIDQTTNRYGGVLRAAMKYVGPNNFDSSFRASGTNAITEWNADTGIYIVNPESKSEGNSGVINYLNKFGSISGSEGLYKQYDPVSELYYEALRYLQGLAATPAATTGTITSTMKQGFPVITNPPDPLMCAPQPQYIIAIADTNAWADKTIPGNPSGSPYNSQGDSSRSVSTNEPNARTWTTNVGAQAVADGLLPLTGGTLTLSQANNLGNWVDSGRGNSFYMAGLAYWAKTQDIRVDDITKPLSTGPQNVTTITIDVAEPSSLQPQERQLFLAGAYGSNDPKNNPNWALASSPQAMINAIDKAFAAIPATSGSLGGGTVTSGVFESGDTGVFVPQFNTVGWSGELMYYALLPGGGGAVTLASTPSWKATQGIPVYNEGLGTTTRKVFLGNRLGGGVTFTWANLSSAQQTMLNTNPRTLLADSNGQARLNFLLGSRIDEGIEPTNVVGDIPPEADGTASGNAKPFRVRANLLGDIVNSAPAYVGKPSSLLSDSLNAGYQAWASDPARANRTRAVYVGTNGGMVHAFNAGTDSTQWGKELFAYIPSSVVPLLNKLTHPGYRHTPMVDGPLNNGEAYALSQWRTILTGGFGAGARGVFALDVTNPSSFGASNILWEFTNTDDNDLGFVTGKPLIVPLMIADGGGNVSAKWFVVTASGYNNYIDGASDKANPFIFFLSLDKAAGTAWVKDINYYKIQLPFDNSSTAPNGLAQPGGVYNRLGALTRLYAGDLRGNLWRVDVSSSNPASWSVANSGTPVFVARDGSNNRQPITTAPAVAFGPRGGYLIGFGTGRLAATGDNLGRAVPPAATAFDQQTFYSVWDDLDTPITTRSKLSARTATVSGSNVTVGGGTVTYGNNTGEVRGCYVDLPSATSDGERVIASPVLSFGRVIFNSIMPGADVCLGGSGRVWTMDLLKCSGSAVGTGTAGYPTTPLVVRTDLTSNPPDPTGFAIDTLKTVTLNLATGGQLVSPPETLNREAKSWSWRELLNWRDLRRP